MKHLLWLIAFILLVSCQEKTQSDSVPDRSLQITVQPFNGLDRQYSLEVAKCLRNYYRAEITIAKSITLPENCRSPYANSRYRADSLLRFLFTLLPDKNTYIIGLTNKDITCTKHDPEHPDKIKSPEYVYRDWGIFGLGSMPGPTCVVSTFRLGHGKVSQKKIIMRLRKIVCHEIGHNLGLPHCKDKKCFMTDALEKIKTIDDAGERLCDDCQQILYHNGISL